MIVRITRLPGRLAAFVLRALILFYRRLISPMLAPHCRYAPSCSAYALEAIACHGAGRGGVLALRRLLRCHPWGGSGFDPVPQLDMTDEVACADRPGITATSTTPGPIPGMIGNSDRT